MYSLRTTLLLLASIYLGVCTTPGHAAEQEFVLEHVPTYELGESRLGRFIPRDGSEILVQQRVVTSSAGEKRVHMIFADKHGVLFERLVDPERIVGDTINGPKLYRVLTTTCSLKALYPLKLGKTYSCTSSVQSGDRVSDSHTSYEIEGVGRDARGALTIICFRNTIDEFDLKVTSRECRTPDGKWLLLIRTLKVVNFSKS